MRRGRLLLLTAEQRGPRLGRGLVETAADNGHEANMNSRGTAARAEPSDPGLKVTDPRRGGSKMAAAAAPTARAHAPVSWQPA
eukprot:g12789.t1